MRILPAAAAAIDAIHPTVPSDRDCCVFARSVLSLAYGAEVIGRADVARWHLYADRGLSPWEPVLAAVDVGIGVRVEQRTVGRWHLCQGWRGTPFGVGVTGHTWLWLQVSEDRGLVVDSTRGRGPSVVGLARWEDFTRAYRGGVAVAVLARPPLAPRQAAGEGRDDLCGDRHGACTLARGHDGPHWSPRILDPW